MQTSRLAQDLAHRKYPQKWELSFLSVLGISCLHIDIQQNNHLNVLFLIYNVNELLSVYSYQCVNNCIVFTSSYQ